MAAACHATQGWGCRFPAWHFRKCSQQLEGLQRHNLWERDSTCKGNTRQASRAAKHLPGALLNKALSAKRALFWSVMQLHKQQHAAGLTGETGTQRNMLVAQHPTSHHNLTPVSEVHCKVHWLPELALHSSSWWRTCEGTYMREQVTGSNHINEETTPKHSNKDCPWQERTKHSTAQSRQEQPSLQLHHAPL